MQEETATIKYIDTFQDKCMTRIMEKEITLSNSINNPPNFLVLQEGYLLSLISTDTSKALIAIKRGNIFILRYIYLNIPTFICLPTCDKCSCHSLSLTLKNIS